MIVGTPHVKRPPQLAKEAGAMASVSALGFVVSKWQNMGHISQPQEALVIDDEIWTHGLAPGGCAFLQGDEQAWIEMSQQFVTLWRGGRLVAAIRDVNRGTIGTVAFTPRGGDNERPINGKFYVGLGDPGGWYPNGDSMERTYMVRRIEQDKAMAVFPNHVVVQSDTPLPVSVGDILRWSQYLGHLAHQVMAGPTQMLRDGVNVVVPFGSGGVTGPDAPYWLPNPRTAIGVTQDGLTVFILAVEGRVPGSIGARIKPLANFMLRLGCWNAANCDGGGSTHMWVRNLKVPGLEWGLVCDSCYGVGTLDGTRPAIYSTAVFRRGT
jgi:hypothetical protein